jgi:hypothetical protein
LASGRFCRPFPIVIVHVLVLDLWTGAKAKRRAFVHVCFPSDVNPPSHGQKSINEHEHDNEKD